MPDLVDNSNIIHRKRKYTDEELLEFLRQYEKEYGKPPTERDLINNPKYPSYKTYVRRFGRFQKALELVKLDIDSIVKKGIVGTNLQKARLAEIFVLEHFIDDGFIDIAGDYRASPVDGMCPKKQIYDVKSSHLRKENHYYFKLDKGEGVDFYYLLAFNEDYSELVRVWRIPWNLTEDKGLYIRTNGSIRKRGGLNIEDMKRYEITEKFMDAFNNWIDRIHKEDGKDKE